MSKHSKEFKSIEEDRSKNGHVLKPTLIQLSSIMKQYPGSLKGEYALKDLTLEIQTGEITAIIGTSGSGKTTLLNILGGLDRSYEGSLKVKGQELRDLSDQALSQWRNQDVGFIFQHFQLLDHMTALENVLLPACLAKGKSRDVILQIQERARTLLMQVGLSEKMNVKPTQLSGGQKQRVAIARALLFEPSLLLCDEPTGSLDKDTGEEIIKLFKDLNEQGYTVLMITHEERLSEVAERVIRLEDGKLISDQRQTKSGVE